MIKIDRIFLSLQLFTTAGVARSGLLYHFEHVLHFLFKRSNLCFEYFTVLDVVLWVEVIVIVDKIDVVVDVVLELVVLVVVEVADTGQILHLVVTTRLSNMIDPVVGDSGTEHLWGIPVSEIEI